MKIENIIRRVLREQEEEKLLRVPFRAFNNDWNILQKFLKSQGEPRYSLVGNLLLPNSGIETLGNLVRVEGNLNLYRCLNLQSLGNLEYVGGWVDLHGCENLQSLGNLEYVENNLNINMTNIVSLKNLKYVGKHLDVYKTPIGKKYTREEIRNIVQVVGKIYDL